MGREPRTVLIVGAGESETAETLRRIQEAGLNAWPCRRDADVPAGAISRSADVIAIELTPGDSSTAIDCIRAIRNHPDTADLPILLVGSSFEAATVESALNTGADDYLHASFSPDDFRVRARLSCRRRSRARVAERSRASLRRKLDVTSLLHEFYEQILAHDSVETTCRRSVETAARLTDSHRVSMLLADSRAHCLKFSHAVGMDRSLWQDRQIPLSSPVAGRVLATGREIVVNRDTAWPRQDRYRNSQFVSVPLVRADTTGDPTVLGVLNVTERSAGLDYESQDVLALRQLARAAAFAIDAVRTRRKLDQTRDSIIFSLAKLSEYRHASTGRHLERVRELSLVLARHLATDPRVLERIDGRFLSDLGRAAPLHDVGKVAIPDRILLKEGRLTPEEFATIRNHTAIGAATLASVMSAGHDDSFLKMAMEIAHCHHERYDGNGYPRGLAGEEIPLSARIVCLADSYDAIRMVREYKRARSHAEATRELLLGSGTQFDPVVVQAFCAVEEHFERIYNSLSEEKSDPGFAPLAAQRV